MWCEKCFHSTLFHGTVMFSGPPVLPDLCHCDFFFWGYLKSKVYSTRPVTIEDLKQRIRDDMLAISEEMTQQVTRNLRGRLEEGVRNGGRHLSDVI
jgi:hypothetical protein